MSAIRDLYHFQETELALEANEQAQAKLAQQLKDESALTAAKNRLAAAQQRLQETAQQQKELEYQIEDLSAKLKTINRKLYDGKTTNPKELSSLQTEAEDFQNKRRGLEDKDLELMESTETIKEDIAAATRELAAAEARWADTQKTLGAELEQVKNQHAALTQEKNELLPQIAPALLAAYKNIRLRRGTAVAKVEAGACRGCRITVSNAELQQAKSGDIVKCNSCGRILYLP